MMSWLAVELNLRLPKNNSPTSATCIPEQEIFDFGIQNQGIYFTSGIQNPGLWNQRIPRHPANDGI